MDRWMEQTELLLSSVLDELTAFGGSCDAAPWPPADVVVVNGLVEQTAGALLHSGRQTRSVTAAAAAAAAAAVAASAPDDWSDDSACDASTCSDPPPASANNVTATSSSLLRKLDAVASAGVELRSNVEDDSPGATTGFASASPSAPNSNSSSDKPVDSGVTGGELAIERLLRFERRNRLKRSGDAVLQPTGQRLLFGADTLAEFCRATQFPYLVLNVYESGYSFSYTDASGQWLETAILPFSRPYCLRQCAAGELPAFLVEALRQSSSNYFLDEQTVVCQIRDFTQAGQRTEARISYTLLRLDDAVLFDEARAAALAVHEAQSMSSSSLVGETTGQSPMEVGNAYESQVVNRRPLCLDPSPVVGLVQNRLLYERLRWSEDSAKRTIKKFTQDSVNRKRRYDDDDDQWSSMVVHPQSSVLEFLKESDQDDNYLRSRLTPVSTVPSTRSTLDCSNELQSPSAKLPRTVTADLETNDDRSLSTDVPPNLSELIGASIEKLLPKPTNYFYWQSPETASIGTEPTPQPMPPPRPPSRPSSRRSGKSRSKARSKGAAAAAAAKQRAPEPAPATLSDASPASTCLVDEGRADELSERIVDRYLFQWTLAPEPAVSGSDPAATDLILTFLYRAFDGSYWAEFRFLNGCTMSAATGQGRPKDALPHDKLMNGLATLRTTAECRFNVGCQWTCCLRHFRQFRDIYTEEGRKAIRIIRFERAGQSHRVIHEPQLHDSVSQLSPEIATSAITSSAAVAVETVTAVPLDAVHSSTETLTLGIRELNGVRPTLVASSAATVSQAQPKTNPTSSSLTSRRTNSSAAHNRPQPDNLADLLQEPLADSFPTAPPLPTSVAVAKHRAEAGRAVVGRPSSVSLSSQTAVLNGAVPMSTAGFIESHRTAATAMNGTLNGNGRLELTGAELESPAAQTALSTGCFIPAILQQRTTSNPVSGAYLSSQPPSTLQRPTVTVTSGASAAAAVNGAESSLLLKTVPHGEVALTRVSPTVGRMRAPFSYTMTTPTQSGPVGSITPPGLAGHQQLARQTTPPLSAAGPPLQSPPSTRFIASSAGFVSPPPNVMTQFSPGAHQLHPHHQQLGPAYAYRQPTAMAVAPNPPSTGTLPQHMIGQQTHLVGHPSQLHLSQARPPTMAQTQFRAGPPQPQRTVVQQQLVMAGARPAHLVDPASSVGSSQQFVPVTSQLTPSHYVHGAAGRR